MITRVAAILTILLSLSGCAPRSGSRLALPASPATQGSSTEPRKPVGPDIWRGLAQRLPPAAGVRLVLTDGRRMRAIFLAAEGTGIVIKRRTRVPEPEMRVGYEAIESLELDTAGGVSAGKAAAIGIGTGAGTFLALMLITFALVSD